MEYRDEDLKRLHEIEVEILLEVIRVCENNGLTYFSYGGTTLGALRHNGFIPWDDDIDIGMMRDDYEKFLVIAPKCLKDGYTLQHFSVDSNTPTYFAKVRRDGTEFVEKYTKNIDMHHGVFIDIMPHDFIPLNIKKRRLYRIRAEICKQLYVSKTVAETTITRGKKKRIRTIERKFLHFFMQPIPKKWLYKVYDDCLRKYNDTDSKLITTRGMQDSENMLEDIFPLKKHRFEDIEINIPANADKVMIQCYGDYMQLPPPEDRITHSPYRLKLN